MFITKSIPVIEQDGQVKDGIEIVNGILLIENKLKFQEGKWYRLADDGSKWFFLGNGANPVYETTGEGIINHNLFVKIFDEKNESVNIETSI